MSTDVSSNPRDGSAIDGLVYHRVEIGAKAIGIDSVRVSCPLGDDCAGHEPPPGNWLELGDGHSVQGDDDSLAGLNRPEDGAGVVAKLALGDGSEHGTRR